MFILLHIIIIINVHTHALEMGKNPKLWVCVWFSFFDDKGLVLLGF